MPSGTEPVRTILTHLHVKPPCKKEVESPSLCKISHSGYATSVYQAPVPSVNSAFSKIHSCQPNAPQTVSEFASKLRGTKSASISDLEVYSGHSEGPGISSLLLSL